MPGEYITIRAIHKSSTQVNTITFCPMHLVIWDTFGNELMHAELVSSAPTTYKLHISYNKSNRLVRFKASGIFKHIDDNILQTGPLIANCMITPEPTVYGGNSHIQFIYQNGSSCEIDLPWGEQLESYVLGNVGSLPSKQGDLKPSIDDKRNPMVFI